MDKTIKAHQSRAVHIDLCNIKYDTTCIDILPGGLPVSIACEVCHSKLDIHSKKSSQKQKKERYKHSTNRCKQYWLTKWSDEGGNKSRHYFTRNSLNIGQDAMIELVGFKKI